MSLKVISPPTLTPEELLELFALPPSADEQALILRYNDAYLPWSELRYKRLPSGCDARRLWGRMRLVRETASMVVWPHYGVRLYTPPAFLERLHALDQLFLGEGLLADLVPSDTKQRYLQVAVIEEAIRSSQIEGATTTRRIAKEMLLKSMPPRDRSQRMIRNSYRAIGWIRERGAEPLTEGLLLELHRVITADTLTSAQDAGRLRTAEDQIYVEDQLTGEVVHLPPSARELPLFVQDLCAFFNASSSEPFIHPILRGIILHFMVAYMHPFVDGNGRTARALFYWYMIRSGYTMMEYLSISQVIRDKKRQYEQAYLQTEADGLDLGYFVRYHLDVLEQAVSSLRHYVERKVEQAQSLSPLLGVGGLSERQTYLLRLYREQPDLWLSVLEASKRLGVTRMTALSDLKGLVEQGFLEERLLNKVKRAYLRSPRFEEHLGELG